MDEEIKDPELEESPEVEEAPEEGEESQEGEPTEEGEEEQLAAPKEEPGPAPAEKTNEQKRIDALVWEREETKRRLNLLKTDPEKYYQMFPEERPAGQPPKAEVPDVEDYESMVIRGGAYDGMTLGQLATSKPLTAQKMLNDYLDGKRKAAEEMNLRVIATKNAWDNDVNSFGAHLSQETYGRGKDDLTEEEFKDISNKIFAVDQWKKTNRKEHYSFMDAYALMNRESELKAAKEGGAKKVVDSLKKSPVGSVSGKTDQSKASIDYESMSEEKLSNLVLNMSDPEADKFYRTAPISVKQKFPDWPWS